MIAFSSTRDNAKKNVFFMVISEARIQIVLALLATLLSIYFLVAGFRVEDRDLKISGVALIVFAFFEIILVFILYCKLAHDIKTLYDTYSCANQLDYNIDRCGDKYKVECLQSNNVIAFSKDDIKYFRIMKSVCIIKLKNKTLMCVPKLQEIISLFK